MLNILIIYLLLNGYEAVIYRLTGSEYSQMPPTMHMDNYELCQQDADALYCMSEYVLVSDKPSPLLNMIQDFSSHQVTHYNHSKLRYGICVTQTCQKFYNKGNGDLRLTLEACLNESMSKEYDLKVNILGENYCKSPAEAIKDVDRLDIIVGTICLILLIVNVIGSILDCNSASKEDNRVVKFLLCFSILRNWKNLTALPRHVSGTRLGSLKFLHGMRVISACLVIFAHIMGCFTVMIANPKYVEEIFLTIPFHFILSGTLMIQTFLILSSFLLVYNLLLYSEKNNITWSMLPKSIFLRWLRLTPTYAIVLALVATWFPHITSGPLWSKYIATEMNDCRRNWWHHILYVNNYLGDAKCIFSSWYLATDMQLYCLGSIIFLACKTSRSRQIVISLLFIAGIIIPAAHVYFQDLNGIVVLNTELITNMDFSDPHFRNVYRSGHTNIIGCAIGMALGYLAYHWQKQRINVKKYQNWICYLLYWSTLFLGLYCFYIGGIFYDDAPRQPLYIRVLFAAFLKPVYGLLIAMLIVGFIFKFEKLYRGILEWNGWRRISPLTYSAYLLNVTVMKNYIGMRTSVTHAHIVSSVIISLALGILNFIAALIVWITVEAPTSNIMREYLLKSPITEEKDKKKNN